MYSSQKLFAELFTWFELMHFVMYPRRVAHHLCSVQNSQPRLHALPVCGVFVLQSAELGYYRSYIDDGKRIDNNILTKNTVF